MMRVRISYTPGTSRLGRWDADAVRDANVLASARAREAAVADMAMVWAPRSVEKKARGGVLHPLRSRVIERRSVTVDWL